MLAAVVAATQLIARAAVAAKPVAADIHLVPNTAAAYAAAYPVAAAATPAVAC